MEQLLVHCKQAKYDVYIGRPTKWGNPFIIGVDGTRTEVINKYSIWLKQQPELMDSLQELRGKVLGCHCYPKRCHGEVLVRLANKPELFRSINGNKEI